LFATAVFCFFCFCSGKILFRARKWKIQIPFPAPVLWRIAASSGMGLQTDLQQTKRKGVLSLPLAHRRGFGALLPFCCFLRLSFSSSFFGGGWLVADCLSVQPRQPNTAFAAPSSRLLAVRPGTRAAPKDCCNHAPRAASACCSRTFRPAATSTRWTALLSFIHPFPSFFASSVANHFWLFDICIRVLARFRLGPQIYTCPFQSEPHTP
jgi:hypothetical protein